MAEIYIKGLDKLNAMLQQLPPKLEQNVLRGALRAAIKPIKAKAELNINSISGDLARGLRISVRAKGGLVRGVLRIRGFEGYKAMWVEYGTRPHYISVQDENKLINYRLSRKRGHTVLESMTTFNRRDRERKSLKIGNNIVGPVVFHPGAQPEPFMRPALDSEARNAVIAAGEYIKKRLQMKHGIDTRDVEIMVDGE